MTDRREPSVADLTAQVKLLLTRVADHGRHHLDEINTDLVQTNFLLREAITDLELRHGRAPSFCSPW